MLKHRFLGLAAGSVLVALSACGGGSGGGPIASRASGLLDTTFGTGGLVITDLGQGGIDTASGMAIQSDGKIVVVGEAYNGSGYDFGVTRYNTDGSLDSTFGPDHNGKVLTDFSGGHDSAYGVAIQPGDQKIVVIGRAYNPATTRDSFAIARYTADGASDPTFGLNGKTMTDMSPGSSSEGHGIAIQGDGKIVAVGRAGAAPTTFAVARYDAHGQLDPSFNVQGILLEDVDWLLVTPAPSGTSEAYDVVIQADQKIVVAGWSYNGGHSKLVLVRLDPGGFRDLAFHGNGIASVQIADASQANAVAIQSDGKILAAGFCRTISATSQFALVRYTSNGNLDLTFGAGGIAITAVGALYDKVQDLAIQSDGKIVAAGSSDDGGKAKFALVRYASDGGLDSTFGASGKMTIEVGTGYSRANGVGFQDDHKIVVAGTAAGTKDDFALIRIWP